MWVSVRQSIAVFKKNLKRHLSNKKKMLSHFLFPLVISSIYYFYKSQDLDDALNVIKIVLQFLLTIYIGLISSSSIRQIITLFINEREEGARQYQYVMGLCKRVHTLSNLFYMMVFTSVYLFPFYVVLNCFGFHLLYVFNFAAFVVSSSFLTIALTSFFTQHKVATEIIGILFSLSAFLPFVYNSGEVGFKYYLARIVPNSAFTLAILSDDETQRFSISFASLLFSKIYLLIFYIVQFRQDFFRTIKQCGGKIRKRIGLGSDGNGKSLMSEIEVESSSVLSSSQTQDDQMRPEVPTIELVEIRKRFGKVMAVDNMSLKIYKSEILGLLGRNGAGKTTLVDMVTKVTMPSSGYIKFNEKDMKVGICYQHEILYEDLSVIDHLRFYAEIKNVEKPSQEIQRIVSKVGIQDELEKKAKQLSGGNKRKLSFSIALLSSPQLLIFDEPTSGLDPLSRRNIWQILEHLRSSQTTIILTTHHLDEADYLSDRICVIKKGNIIESGTPAQIKQKHGKGYYLTLYYNSVDPKVPFDTRLYSKILSDSLGQVQISDRGSESIQYFIHNKTSYKDLIKCVETLQRLECISIALEVNSLQQSFIALNVDSPAGLIVDQVPANQGLFQNPESDSSTVSNFSQIKGIILKNFYCYIGKFHYFYNLNIIILIFVTLLNSLLLSKISQSVSSSELQASDQQKSNFLFVLQGYIIMSSAFLAIPVLQKEEKIIQLLRTRGVKKVNYWIGHFLFDFSYFWLNYGVMYWWFQDSMGGVKLSVVAFTAASMIIYAYCASMLFSKVKTANSWFTIFNSLLFLVMMPFIISEGMVQNSIYGYLKPLKYIFPFFDISAFLMKKSDLFQALQLMGQSPKEQIYISHFCFLFYLILFILLQSSVIQRLLRRENYEQILDQIKLEGVSKKYGAVEALRNVNYSINNERVALLGHNGAGKSTTFGLLSAQLNASEGKVFLEKKLKRRYQDVMDSAGICYQEDTLWKFMSPAKIINIFSRFVNISDSQQQLDWLFENLDIERELKERKIENLSGGNKRKICMAVCLMGQPDIKLLDECSTGLDPVSRQSMVNMIKMQSHGSVVFTTHSIGEAEQICSRAIIMKKGEVSEDNKIFRLKQKYYNCYWVELKMEEGQNLQQIVPRVFQGLKPEDYKIEVKKSRVEIRKESIKLCELMRALAKSKAKDLIRDFNIGEPKLEDVYLLLTAEENEDGEIELGQMGFS